jgi:SanA protein
MKRIKYLIGILASIFLVVLIVNVFIIWKSSRFIYKNANDVPSSYTALVLGALVSKSGYLSDFLQDRMDMALELYRAKKIKRFLLSGDHGHVDYDEVNNMKNYLIDKGVDTKDIFLDHAGFDTYNSMVRAKEIFEINDVIIVTQKFHLSRAVYIARCKGLNAYGMIADKRNYTSIKRLKLREVLANIKAFGEILFNREPKFLGDKIPITGDSKLSYD